MQDVVDKQIELGTPDLSAQYPKIGKPQIGTLSLSGNDLGFGNIVNACLYHWVGYGDCTQLLKDAHAALDDPAQVFELKLIDTIRKILLRARRANAGFQLYIPGYIQFWNDQNPQCNTVSWAPSYKQAAYQIIALRSDMNSLVDALNTLLSTVANAFDTHRFCEVEADPSYHTSPIDARTWFIHYDSPFFDQVNSVLIPPKNGQSTADQITAVDGDLAKINPVYNDVDSMTAALTKLAQDDVKHQVLPMTWIRVMHPEGSGYKPMSDAVIDAVLKYGAAGASASGGGSPGTHSAGVKCTTGANGNNKFLARDDLNNQIGTFCGVAAQQGVQDHNGGSIVRTYNQGQRYQVTVSLDWPPGQDITQNIEQNCIDGMTLIMDSYTPGNCTFHLEEDESWSGVNSPGFERHWDFHLQKLTLDDGAGVIIGTSPPGSPIDAGDGNSFSWNTKLPNPLVMTPEAQGNPADYIQFTIGTESWQSSQNDDTKMPFCNVGGFNSDYSLDVSLSSLHLPLRTWPVREM
ncbi:hypothetical protein MMC17_000018 [Xylographa soralifera]|nr:hypothetical protein [Xylographa soralifera]